MAEITIDNVTDYSVDRSRLIFLHQTNNGSQDDHLVNNIPSDVDNVIVCWSLEAEGARMQLIDMLHMDQGEDVGKPSYSTIPDVLFWRPSFTRTTKAYNEETETVVDVVDTVDACWDSLRIDDVANETWTTLKQRIADVKAADAEGRSVTE